MRRGSAAATVKKTIGLDQLWKHRHDGSLFRVRHVHRADRLARGPMVQLYETDDGNLKARRLQASITFTALGRDWERVE